MGYYDPETNTSQIKKYRLRDGKETILLSTFGQFYNHISCQNHERLGWRWVSTYNGEARLVDDPLNWLPFESEIFALKLDGSGQVQRLAHHRSRRFSLSTPDADHSEYWAEPHASVSRRGNRVVFGSNWQDRIAEVQSVDAYVIEWLELSHPQMTLQRESESVKVAWKDPSGLWILESCWDLSAGTGWVEYAPTPSKTEDYYEVIISKEPTSCFFRLKRRL